MICHLAMATYRHRRSHPGLAERAPGGLCRWRLMAPPPPLSGAIGEPGASLAERTLLSGFGNRVVEAKLRASRLGGRPRSGTLGLPARAASGARSPPALPSWRPPSCDDAAFATFWCPAAPTAAIPSTWRMTSDAAASGREPLQSLSVSRGSLLDDLAWKGRRRRLLVPATRLQPVSDVLLVEARLRPAHDVVGRRPEAR